MCASGLVVTVSDYEAISFHIIDEARTRAPSLYTKPLSSLPNRGTKHGGGLASQHPEVIAAPLLLRLVCCTPEEALHQVHFSPLSGLLAFSLLPDSLIPITQCGSQSYHLKLQP